MWIYEETDEPAADPPYNGMRAQWKVGMRLENHVHPNLWNFGWARDEVIAFVTIMGLAEDGALLANTYPDPAHPVFAWGHNQHETLFAPGCKFLCVPALGENCGHPDKAGEGGGWVPPDEWGLPGNENTCQQTLQTLGTDTHPGMAALMVADISPLMTSESGAVQFVPAMELTNNIAYDAVRYDIGTVNTKMGTQLKVCLFAGRKIVSDAPTDSPTAQPSADIHVSTTGDGDGDADGDHGGDHDGHDHGTATSGAGAFTGVMTTILAAITAYFV
jgi:hypothetical protein